MRLTILLASALFIGGVQQAAGCKCAQDPNAPPEGSEAAVVADLAGSAVVFTGRVTRIRSRVRLFLRLPRYRFLTRGDRDLDELEEERIFRRRVQLKVEESFKGAATGKIVLYTGWGGGDCGYEFRRGSRYLVYASDTGGDSGDWLYTGICHATKGIEAAAAEIAILQRLKAQNPSVGSAAAAKETLFQRELTLGLRSVRRASVSGRCARVSSHCVCGAYTGPASRDAAPV